MIGAQDYTKWRFWMDLVQMAGTVLIGVYVWLVNRKAAQEKRCEASKKRITALEGKASEIEMKLRQMPQQDDIKELREEISNLNGTMREFIGRTKGINRAVDLMNEFLINQGANK